MRQIWRHDRRDDRGSTLVVAMMVMGVALSLSLVVIGVAITSSRTTGADRQRLVAVNAAEAAVDAAYASIQASGLSLPCAWPASGTRDVRAYPDTATTSAVISYETAAGPTSCPLAAGVVPVRAVITGTGTTWSGGTQQRKMQALVNLTPVAGDGLDKALFGESLVALSNNAQVSGASGLNADVYSNGNFFCDNSPTFQGSILAPNGSITMESTCSATGDVWAKGNVVLSGNKTIGGRALSATGSITADGNTDVNGTLIAAGSIGWSKCTAAKCLTNQSAVPLPPTSPFPELRGDAATLATWEATSPGPGYTTVAIPSVTCGAAAGDWLAARVATLSTRTLYTTACAVEFSKTKEIQFAQDVAVFARGGVSTSNQVGFASTSSTTTRTVHLVQPYDAAVRPCTTSPVMGPTQQFSSTPQISLMWYSPCDISYGNQGGSYGQVYSGSQLTTNNQYTLTFRRLPLWGVSPSSMPTTAYAVDVVYKRETR